MLGALEVRFAVRVLLAFFVIRIYDCTTEVRLLPSKRKRKASVVTCKTY
jgi:hypothetical protein